MEDPRVIQGKLKVEPSRRGQEAEENFETKPRKKAAAKISFLAAGSYYVEKKWDCLIKTDQILGYLTLL